MKRKPAKRTKAKAGPPVKVPAGATPNACFISGAAVTESQFRAIRALEAMQAGERKSMENELSLASYSLETVRRVVQSCATNKEEIDALAKRTIASFDAAEKVGDRLERESRLRAVRREAKQSILQVIAIARSCEEKVRDRCMPEQIPAGAPVMRKGMG